MPKSPKEAIEAMTDQELHDAIVRAKRRLVEAARAWS